MLFSNIDHYYHSSDPDFVPNKALQHVHAVDNAQWQQPTRPRFDTTYRTEYINRIRHPVCIHLFFLSHQLTAHDDVEYTTFDHIYL